MPTPRCSYEHPILPGDFDTLAEIQQANEDAGYFFFSPNTMAFFGGELVDRVWAGCLFVDSTQQPSSAGPYPRRWSLRVCHPDGNVCTIGAFEKYATEEAATAAAADIADRVHRAWRDTVTR